MRGTCRLTEKPSAGNAGFATISMAQIATLPRLPATSPIAAAHGSAKTAVFRTITQHKIADRDGGVSALDFDRTRFISEIEMQIALSSVGNNSGDGD